MREPFPNWMKLVLGVVALLTFGRIVDEWVFGRAGATVESWSSSSPALNNATPPAGAPEGMAASATNGVMRYMMSQIRRVAEQSVFGNFGPVGGAANAITVTPTVTPIQYLSGQVIRIIPTAANTITNPTIKVGSLATATIAKLSNQNLLPGDIAPNVPAELIFHSGLSGFVLLNPQSTHVSAVQVGLNPVTASNLVPNIILSRAVFTGSGAWTVAASSAKFTYTGGGAGGGGSCASNETCGGGGAGATGIKWVHGITQSTINIGIGAGGGAGANGGATTVTGSNFGAMSAGGGSTPASDWLGGAGGTVTDGDVNVTGGDGDAGDFSSAGNDPGGNGGASVWGSGGRAGTDASNPNGSAGNAFGSGGGGGHASGTSAGGNSGIVIIEFMKAQ